jgi:hypothetical protein
MANFALVRKANWRFFTCPFVKLKSFNISYKRIVGMQIWLTYCSLSFISLSLLGWLTCELWLVLCCALRFFSRFYLSSKSHAFNRITLLLWMSVTVNNNIIIVFVNGISVTANSKNSSPSEKNILSLLHLLRCYRYCTEL